MLLFCILSISLSSIAGSIRCCRFGRLYEMCIVSVIRFLPTIRTFLALLRDFNTKCCQWEYIRLFACSILPRPSIAFPQSSVRFPFVLCNSPRSLLSRDERYSLWNVIILLSERCGVVLCFFCLHRLTSDSFSLISFGVMMMTMILSVDLLHLPHAFVLSKCHNIIFHFILFCFLFLFRVCEFVWFQHSTSNHFAFCCKR